MPRLAHRQTDFSFKRPVRIYTDVTESQAKEVLRISRLHVSLMVNLELRDSRDIPQSSCSKLPICKAPLSVEVNVNSTAWHTNRRTHTHTHTHHTHTHTHTVLSYMTLL